MLLCAIAVAMAARRYVHRHLDTVALLKTLGATRNFTLALSLLQLLMIALAAALVGAAARFRGAGVAAAGDQGPAGGHGTAARRASCPIAIGFAAAIAVLAGFALPPLLQLSRVPALRVLRRDVGPPPPLVVLAFGPALAVVLALIYWVVRDLRLFCYFTAGLAVFVVLLALAGFALVYLAGRLARPRRRRLALRRRQLKPPARRERRADRGLRRRHHGAAAAGHHPRRSERGLAAHPAGGPAELFLRQHSARRARRTSSTLWKRRARAPRACCR